jgi:hypothetical protein
MLDRARREPVPIVRNKHSWFSERADLGHSYAPHAMAWRTHVQLA